MAEQRIRNAQVSGSTPLIGSTSSGYSGGFSLCGWWGLFLERIMEK